MENKLEKKYGLFTAICMVVGIVVGSGVFFKAQVILQKTGGDMPLGILAWIIGGTIMIICILTFAAMAQRYEKVNGIVDYAEAIVGKRYGYYIGWFLSTTYYPTLTSALAWLSARYTLVFVTSVPISRSSFRPRRAAASSVPSASRSCSSTWSAPTPSTRSRRSSPVSSRSPPPSSSSFPSRSWRSSASFSASPTGC